MPAGRTIRRHFDPNGVGDRSAACSIAVGTALGLGSGGRIQSIERREGEHLVLAIAPLADLFGWTNRARSLSAGRASSAMEVSGYERVPVSALTRALTRAA